MDRKRRQKMSNAGWVHPHDAAAEIARFQDGRTALASLACRKLLLQIGDLLLLFGDLLFLLGCLLAEPVNLALQPVYLPSQFFPAGRLRVPMPIRRDSLSMLAVVAQAHERRRGCR